MPNSTAQRLVSVIESAMSDLIAREEDSVQVRPQPGKWSAKEILGHLIDSALNNHQRFVRAQLQENLIFPGYQQDKWVTLQRYQESEWQDLVTLWYALNHHIARVLEAIPTDKWEKAYAEHSYGSISFIRDRIGETASIADFAEDYVDHLEHHLRQILAPNI